MSAPEKLKIDEHHSEQIDRINSLYSQSMSSDTLREYLNNRIVAFYEKLRTEFSGTNLKGIPELERLRGGSEEPDEGIDKETHREILEKLDAFLDETEAYLNNKESI